MVYPAPTSSATFSSIRRRYLFFVCPATISTHRVTGRPEDNMMENWEQIRASCFSEMRKPTGFFRAFSRSFTGSSRVMMAQVSRSWATASYSS